MYLLWTHHPTDPSKNGTKEDIKNGPGENALAFGYAVAAQRIPRGAPGWLAEQQEIEAARQATIPPDPNRIVGVQWGVHERTTGAVAAGGHAYITRRTQFEVQHGDDKSFPDCPKSILQRFYEINKLGNPEALAEARIQAQYKQEAADREQKAREYGSAVAKFGTQVVRS
jgi:hypothetical protein